MRIAKNTPVDQLDRAGLTRVQDPGSTLGGGSVLA